MKKHARTAVLVPALLLLALAPAACGSGDGGDAQSAADTLTRRQKDSIISTAPVPGAGAVGKALRVSDSVAARAERHDSMLDGN